MFIPGLIRLMVVIYRDCSGKYERQSWRWWAVWCAVTPLYPLYVISDSILTAVDTLRGVLTEGNIKDTKEIKLSEIIGE